MNPLSTFSFQILIIRNLLHKQTVPTFVLPPDEGVFSLWMDLELSADEYKILWSRYKTKFDIFVPQSLGRESNIYVKTSLSLPEPPPVPGLEMIFFPTLTKYVLTLSLFCLASIFILILIIGKLCFPTLSSCIVIPGPTISTLNKDTENDAIESQSLLMVGVAKNGDETKNENVCVT